jgi:hypothetical protein
MAAKPPLPTSGRKIARGAVMIAIAALQDERVRAQLAKAPATARTWAASRRSADRRDTDGGAGGPSTLARLDPTQRFGQRGIERRLGALQRHADEVFPDRSVEPGLSMHRAIDELGRAASISATMPLNERRRARSRITAELTRLELALVDAVLPPAD